MRNLLLIAVCALIACGSESPVAPKPSPGPTEPKPQDQFYTLENLRVDSGPEPFELNPPNIAGHLNLYITDRYEMSFRISVLNLKWSKSIVGQYKVVGDTLRFIPDDSLRTEVQAYTQTLIIDDVNIVRQNEKEIIIPLPIRPGAWREEDTLLLTYALQDQVLASRIKGSQIQAQVLSADQVYPEYMLRIFRSIESDRVRRETQHQRHF